MANNLDNKFTHYTKVAWRIYALIAILIMAVLVLFIARDTEEMFFYGLLTPAAFYVFRPTNRYIGRLVYKYTGVSQDGEQD
jgi:hypothetical protein